MVDEEMMKMEVLRSTVPPYFDGALVVAWKDNKFVVVGHKEHPKDHNKIIDIIKEYLSPMGVLDPEDE
jgi:hypothetical protein